MDTPLIAVVIPAYNRAATLRRCLDSVVGQTVSPSEVIVVDDGSDDGTADIARAYGDMGVRCIQLPHNAGAQAARNRGIAESTAEWIAFLDSDDEWLPGKLERQVAELEAVDFDPWTVLHTGALRKPANQDVLEPVQLPLVNGGDVYATLLCRPGPLFPSLIASRVALARIDYLDERVPSYQEWDTSIRLARDCRFVLIEEPLFIYHLHDEPTISKEKELDVRGYEYVIRKFEAEIKEVCGAQGWERHLRFQLIRCLNWGLWERADAYFAQIETKDREYRALQVCRRLHAAPAAASRMRRRLTAK